MSGESMMKPLFAIGSGTGCGNYYPPPRIKNMSEKPHSADYFGDTRDFWWNRDFLQLMSERWKLPAVKNALDVGCGVGHWGRCLAPFLRPGGRITGVDREARWIEEAQKRSVSSSHVTFSFQQGEAERLPFPDNSFDLVTCQTVLIHVKDPLVAIREMVRVLAPGGLIAIVEPNNLAGNLGGVELEKPVVEIIRLLEFQLICERGKKNLGEGFNSCGPYVAGWLSELNLEHIESYLSDKTTLLLPPYASPQANAIVREIRAMSQRDFWIWNREDTHRYFTAGGGEPERFEACWGDALASEQAGLHSIAQGTLRANYTPVCLLVSARKPGAQQ